MYIIRIFLTGLILFVSGIQADVAELPDPFLMNNGSRVKNANDWKTRREELKEKFQLLEYGHFATASPVTVVNFPTDSIIKSERGTVKKRIIHLKTGNDGSKAFTINLFVPENGEGPFPVIVVGDLCWGSLQRRLKPAGLASLVNRGYIIAEFDRTLFSPDKNLRDSQSDENFDTGAIVEWAWGFHRAIDYIMTLNLTDKSKIVVTGWSRGGKAALLAGAFDERIALVAPNCSGTSGSGPLRFVDTGGEKPENIVNSFPYWFCSNFKNYMGENRNKLPFDQHSLISLVAPRAYLCTNGLNDKWANPVGTAQAHLAAKEVFTALAAQDKIGIFYVNSGHDHNIDKWIALIDFADKVFYGKPTSYNYNSIPFPDLKKAFSWSAPKLK
jgi:hypothetical protein